MNKNQVDQMQFSLEKRPRKKKMNSSNPSYLMDCVIKWGIRFINSIKNFFVCLKMFIMKQRKNSWDETKRMGGGNCWRFSYALAIMYISSSAMCVWWWDWFKIKMSKKAPSMVVLSELSSLFVKISICDALSSHDLFNDVTECVTP